MITHYSNFNSAASAQAMASAVANGAVRPIEPPVSQPPSLDPPLIGSVKSSSAIRTDSDPPLPLPAPDYSHYNSKVTIDNFDLLKVSSLFLPLRDSLHSCSRL